MSGSISMAILTAAALAVSASAATTSAAAESPDSSQTMNGDMTYYYPSRTACGQTYTGEDMIAAISSQWFTTDNPNVDPICGRQALITDPATGNTVQVEIRDSCGECERGDIDVSPAAFQTLQPLVVGRYEVSWVYV